MQHLLVSATLTDLDGRPQRSINCVRELVAPLATHIDVDCAALKSLLILVVRPHRIVNPPVKQVVEGLTSRSQINLRWLLPPLVPLLVLIIRHLLDTNAEKVCLVELKALLFNEVVRLGPRPELKTV